MGSLFGRTGISVEKGLSPTFDLLASRPGYEIRWYAPYLVAEVAMEESNGAFGILAKYIGVFGTPANAASGGSAESISMTAPVVMTPPGQPEAMSMTAPVVSEPGTATSDRKMQFIMPAKYGDKVEALPKPTDARVSLRRVDGRGIFCRTYSGWVNPDKERLQLTTLLQDMAKDGLVTPPSPPSSTTAPLEGGWSWLGSQYHPPFTLPFLRKNEIWLVAPMSETELRKIAAGSGGSGATIASTK